MQCVTQLQFRAETLKYSVQLRKNNIPLCTVQKALCSGRFFLWIIRDNTHRNAICQLSMRFCYTKPLPTRCRTINMYLSTWSRFFFLIEIDLGMQSMLKMVSIPAQFWEVNLLNCICSRQVLVVCRILQHQKLFTEWPEEREGREGMNNTERLFFLLLEPQH